MYDTFETHEFYRNFRDISQKKYSFSVASKQRSEDSGQRLSFVELLEMCYGILASFLNQYVNGWQTKFPVPFMLGEHKWKGKM